MAIPDAEISAVHFYFLADRTATRAVRSALGIVLLSSCNAVHCGAQGQRRGLKVVPSYSYSSQGTSYSLLLP